MKSIPVNTLDDEYQTGIAIGKISSDSLQLFDEAGHSHRHDYHTFILAQKGNVHIEIDFERHKIKAPAILYIHPNQVHRILKAENIDFYLLRINNEKIHSHYLKLLEQNIVPVKSLPLQSDIFAVFKQAISLCVTIFERKNDKLYASLLKDSCNAFIGLIVSQYLEQSISTSSLSRFDIITREFKLLLERDFTIIKRPSDFANALHISTTYLNECVRNATGFSVSHHLQQRIILEAKRLLYHSNKSIKEIANELGYNDYAYFSRLFTKTAGMTALAFRNKSH